MRGPLGNGVLHEAVLDLVHGRALEPVRQVAALGGLQTHPRASTKLVGAHRCDVNEEEAAGDFRGEFCRCGRSVRVVRRMLVGHSAERITRQGTG